jgi:hypothetical protein
MVSGRPCRVSVSGWSASTWRLPDACPGMRHVCPGMRQAASACAPPLGIKQWLYTTAPSSSQTHLGAPRVLHQARIGLHAQDSNRDAIAAATETRQSRTHDKPCSHATRRGRAPRPVLRTTPTRSALARARTGSPGGLCRLLSRARPPLSLLALLSGQQSSYALLALPRIRSLLFELKASRGLFHFKSTPKTRQQGQQASQAQQLYSWLRRPSSRTGAEARAH